MPEALKNQLDQVTHSASMLTLNMRNELTGKSFGSGPNSPIRALIDVQEALYLLQRAQQKLNEVEK